MIGAGTHALLRGADAQAADILLLGLSWLVTVRVWRNLEQRPVAHNSQTVGLNSDWFATHQF